jgi:hypothetical protein
MINPSEFYRADGVEAAERADPWCGPVELFAHERADADNLKAYWLHGPGLKKWATKPHPWTALYHHILKHVGMPDRAKRIASQWFHDHFGYWPGSRKGKNPVGRG